MRQRSRRALWLRATLVATFALTGLSGPVRAGTLVVGNKGDDTASFIDLPTGTKRARTPTAKAPHEVAVSPNGRLAAVAAYGWTTVDPFDVATGRQVHRIDLAPHAGPHGIVWLRDNRPRYRR